RNSRAVCVGVALSAVFFGGQARGEDVPSATWTPAATAKYMEARADWWLTWSSSARGQGTACVSCHTTMPIALALPALGRTRGESKPTAVETKLMDTARKRVANWDKIVAKPTGDKDPFVPFYAGNKKASALGTEAVLNALILVNHDAIWN